MMKKIKIKISGADNITRLVEQASLVEEPGVYIHKGKTIIDATSLVGMLALDTSQPIIVEFPSSAIDFENYLKEFIF